MSYKNLKRRQFIFNCWLLHLSTDLQQLRTTSFSSLTNVPRLSTAAASLSIFYSISQANLDSLSSQLDDNLWRTNKTSFASKDSASSKMASSSTSSSTSSSVQTKDHFMICRSSSSPGSSAIFPPWWAVIFVFEYILFPRPSLSPHETSPKS